VSRKNKLLSLFPLIVVATIHAEAGTIVNNNWTPSGCGPAPVPASLDLANLDAYNASVGAVNDFRKNNSTYVNCLIREANSDIQTITKSAKSAQQAAHDTDDKIIEDEKVAEKKFPK